MSDREELREEFDRTQNVVIARQYMAKIEECYRSGEIGLEAYAFEAIRVLPYVIQDDYKEQLDKTNELIDEYIAKIQRFKHLVIIQSVVILLLFLNTFL